MEAQERAVRTKLKRAGQSTRETQWIDSTDQLRSCLEQLGNGPLALDSESDSLHHYPEKVCLVQLSTPEADLLIDPLAGVDLAGPLAPILGDPGVRKILHGADYDLRVLDRDFGLTFRGLFDTMVAARLIGLPAFGLSALIERFVGHKVSKRFQRADWALRPLTAEMTLYAIEDTRHLSTLAGFLEEELDRRGRGAWAAEEFERLEHIRFTPPAPDGFLRVRGSVALDRRGLGVLRELHDLRDHVARQRDRPPFKIMGDDMLIAIAAEPPREARALTRATRLGSFWSRPKPKTALLAAVQRGLAIDDAQLPERPRSRLPRRDRDFDARVKQISRQRDQIAADLELEPSIVAPRALLEQILTRCEAGEKWRDLPALRRWQATLLEPLVETRLSPDPGVP